VPTGLQIAKMDKVLGVKLPRPNKHWFEIRDILEHFFWLFKGIII
jgi:hypothetical protein